MEKWLSDISSLHFLLCGGVTIPQKIAYDCQQLGIKLLSVYGPTESSPRALVNLDDSLPHMMDTDGYAATDVEIKVINKTHNTLLAGVKGEGASHSPNVSTDYLDGPELTARALDQNGWYYSGDSYRMDDAGYIKITERKKDIIVCGGENISSREVEDISLQYPHIHGVCVVMMPDERLGGRSCAYVVLKPPHHSLPLESVVVLFSREWVAKYKYPERIIIAEKLPRTVSGKVQRYQLRQDTIQCLGVESTTG